MMTPFKGSELNIVFVPEKLSINKTVNGNFVFVEGEIRVGDETFQAISGKWGKPIDHGIYDVNFYNIDFSTFKKVDSYKRDGYPWYLFLTPEFTLNRNSLLIHPDGGVEGTEGCIGLTDEDIVFFELVKEYLDIGCKVKLYVL
jgi:hypothetical protein